MSHNSVAALAVLCIFGAPVAAFITFRVLAHRERIEMIRRGMLPAGMRAGRVVGSAPVWGPGPEIDSADRSLRKGITLTCVGFAILIGLSFIGYDGNGAFGSPRIHPGPWLLGGLIPMFVGIAQIIIALLSGARVVFYTRSNPAPGVENPFHEPPPHQPRAPYEAERRTHSGFDELKRPVPPPDRR